MSFFPAVILGARLYWRRTTHPCKNTASTRPKVADEKIFPIGKNPLGNFCSFFYFKKWSSEIFLIFEQSYRNAEREKKCNSTLMVSTRAQCPLRKRVGKSPVSSCTLLLQGKNDWGSVLEIWREKLTEIRLVENVGLVLPHEEEEVLVVRPSDFPATIKFFDLNLHHQRLISSPEDVNVPIGFRLGIQGFDRPRFQIVNGAATQHKISDTVYHSIHDGVKKIRISCVILQIWTCYPPSSMAHPTTPSSLPGAEYMNKLSIVR